MSSDDRSLWDTVVKDLIPAVAWVVVVGLRGYCGYRVWASHGAFDSATIVWFLALFVVFIVAAALTGYLRNSTWTGFGKPVIDKKTGKPVPTPKTLWDLLQLMVIPAFLVFGVWYLNEQQATADRTNANRQATATTLNADRQATATAKISLDKTHSAVLDAYLDRISDLLLTGELNGPHPSLAVRTVARARTLTALRRLDHSRRSLLLEFLADSHLISLVRLDEAALSGVQLRNAQLEHAHLERADFSSAYLVRANLIGADLQYAKMPTAHLAGATAINAKIKDANLVGAVLDGSMLGNADLRYAKLARVHMVNASLFAARLAGADLTGAHLTGADLYGTSLIGAHLGGADLTNADLAQANLSRADLTGATLDGVSWSHTVCPDGTTSDQNGTIPESCLGHLG